MKKHIWYEKKWNVHYAEKDYNNHILLDIWLVLLGKKMFVTTTELYTNDRVFETRRR